MPARYPFKRKHQADIPIGGGLGGGWSDELKADEIDFGLLLLYQLNDIRKFDNEGRWSLYVNAVKQLEMLLEGYTAEDSTSALQYRNTIKTAKERYGLNGTRDMSGAKPFEKKRYQEQREKEYYAERQRALMIFMKARNFLPRDRLG